MNHTYSWFDPIFNDDGKLIASLENRMIGHEIVAWRRSVDKRYENLSDEQVLQDFIEVNWAKIV